MVEREGGSDFMYTSQYKVALERSRLQGHKERGRSAGQHEDEDSITDLTSFA
jgi:hypothetical protein